ncbi:zinc finger HIT domain-containing protein 1-like [Hydractinia symbiolongicarpus]|uniref:zinc finger HIT domain-containing protein 1-like n=1 Tax=Hydractinia symbiolongicarpus TaxID=13093 RepID=UPI00254C394D|nr:zinc finger HIT domain-containing protein 1-like [Hydractinia symbiolongicarpus]
MSDKRGSSRLKEIQRKHVVDEETRAKRQKRQLASLEKDNYQDDPHHQMNLYVAKAKLPSFNDNNETKKRRKVKLGDIFKQKAKRSFAALTEELQAEAKEGVPNYFNAAAPKSILPERRFCSVCGYLSNYTCPTCGVRYCCAGCLKTHRDTRCMKWTA